MAKQGHWPKRALLLGLIAVVGSSFAGFDQVRSRSESVLKPIPQRPDNDNVVLELVGEGIVRGGAMYVYPWPQTPKPQVTDAVAHTGDYSLEMVLTANAWSGAQICLSSAIDLTPYFEDGGLTMAVRGTKGGEIFSFSLMDDGLNSDGHLQQAWPPASTRSYGIMSKDEWFELTVPLRDFGGVGSYWSDALNKRVSAPFNWKGIRCLGMDIDKNRFTSFKVYVDDIRIVKKVPKGLGGGGDGYPFKNEGF
jgi:hypothetical protein